MEKISAKRRALCLERLGYVPRRTLTRSERVLCGLEVKDKHESSRIPISRIQPGKIRPRKSSIRQTATRNRTSGKIIQPRCGDPLHAPAGVGFNDPRSYITKDGRLRLKGEDYEALRRQAYERAGGMCECLTVPHAESLIDFPEPCRCANPAPWDGSVFTRGHLAHLKHGPRKSDTLDQVIWSCAACHFAEHGPRWRKQKMAKAWEECGFIVYYRCDSCVCGNDKANRAAMCDGCREHLRETQPALLHDIENATGKPLLIAMGEFESLVRKAQ